MFSSRLLFSSLKNRSAVITNSLARFDSAKRFHSSSYLRSVRQTNQPLMSSTRSTTQRSQSWSWTSYIIPPIVLGGIGGVAYLIHYNDERRVIMKGDAVNCGINSTKGPVIGGPFNLLDTEGRSITEQNLLGNWVLLYFGYTSSPDVGPSEVEKMAKAVEILESKRNLKVLPVFVTIDPQRDNPPQLQAYLKEFDSRIVGLTGSVAAIKDMAREYRVYYKKVEEDGDDYLVDSSHNMYLMNPKLKVLRCFGLEYNADELSEAIVKEINSDGNL